MDQKIKNNMAIAYSTIKDELKNYYPNNQNINFFILRREEGTKTIDYEVLQTNLDNKTKEELVKNISTQLENVANNKNYGEVEFCPVTKPPNGVIQKMNKDIVKGLDDIIGQFDGESSKDLDIYNPDEDMEVWGFVISISTSEKDDKGFQKKIVFFQKARERNMLKPKTHMGIVKKEGSYTEVSNPDIIVIEREMDCVCYNDEVFIFKKQNFEFLFGFIEKYKKYIKDELDKINDPEGIINYETMYETLENNPTALKKLYKGIKDKKLYLLTYENIEKLRTEKFVSIKLKDGKIVYEYKNLLAVLRLLEKEYIRDIFEEEKFISLNKISPDNQ